MIVVEWYDFDNRCNRTGRLLQMARGGVDGRTADVAYVVAPQMPNDENNAHLQGRTDGSGNISIIKVVEVKRLVVRGAEIPLM